MDWMNIHIPSAIRSPAYVGSSPAERGTWLSVLAYACEIECGGRIEGAAHWKDRQWQQACGVTLREVRTADRLLKLDGADLLVNGYPAEKEKQVRHNRGVGMAGAMARWGKGNGTGNGTSMPSGMPSANGEGEGEGEGEGGRATATPHLDEDPFTGNPALPSAHDLRVKTLADLEQLCPGTHIGRNERETWEALLRGYTWEPMLEACRASHDAKTGRIYLSAVKTYLAANFRITEDPHGR